MATLNITPARGIIRSGTSNIPISGYVYTDLAFDTTLNDTVTALPYGGNNNGVVDYFHLYCDGDMKIGLGNDSMTSTDCKMYIPAGFILQVPNLYTHIIKRDL